MTQRPFSALQFPLIQLPGEDVEYQLEEEVAYAAPPQLTHGVRPFIDLLTEQTQESLGFPLLHVPYSPSRGRGGELFTWEEEEAEIVPVAPRTRFNLITEEEEEEELPAITGFGPRELLSWDELTPAQLGLLDLPPELLLPILEDLLVAGDTRGVLSLCAASREARKGICQSQVRIPGRFPSLEPLVKVGLLPEWSTLLQVAMNLPPLGRIQHARCELAALVLIEQRLRPANPLYIDGSLYDVYSLPRIPIDLGDVMALVIRFADIQRGPFSFGPQNIGMLPGKRGLAIHLPLFAESSRPSATMRYFRATPHTNTPFGLGDRVSEEQMRKLAVTPEVQDMVLATFTDEMAEALLVADVDCVPDARRLAWVPGLQILVQWYEAPDQPWSYAIFVGIDVNAVPEFVALGLGHDKVYWTYRSVEGVTQLATRPIRRVGPLNDDLLPLGTQRKPWTDLKGGLEGKYFIEDTKLPKAEEILADVGYHRIY